MAFHQNIPDNHTIQNSPDIMRITLSITCRFSIIGADKESDIAGSKKEAFMTDIAYQNKDITAKYFGKNLKEKSFSAYGLEISKIRLR